MLFYRCTKNFLNFSYIINTKLRLVYIVTNNNCSIFAFVMPTKTAVVVGKDHFHLFGRQKVFLNYVFSQFFYLFSSYYTSYILKVEIIGIGYKLLVKNQCLYIFLGYSHFIKIRLPAEIKIEKNNKYISIYHTSKYTLGNIYHFLKKLRKIDKYKGKGIKNIYDILILKEGKSRIIKNK